MWRVSCYSRFECCKLLMSWHPNALFWTSVSSMNLMPDGACMLCTCRSLHSSISYSDVDGKKGCDNFNFTSNLIPDCGIYIIWILNILLWKTFNIDRQKKTWLVLFRLGFLSHFTFFYIQIWEFCNLHQKKFNLRNLNIFFWIFGNFLSFVSPKNKKKNQVKKRKKRS